MSLGEVFVCHITIAGDGSFQLTQAGHSQQMLELSSRTPMQGEADFTSSPEKSAFRLRFAHGRTKNSRR